MTTINDVKMICPSIKCIFIPITMDNYHRVGEFRERDRISEYRTKLIDKELGFFVEHSGNIVASIWATINSGQVSMVARRHIRLRPNEALIHDIVTGETCRGNGIGPFMVGKIVSALLNEYGSTKIIIDVNVNNHSSLRMMQKTGLQQKERVLCLSVLGKFLSHTVLRKYV